MKRTRMEDLSTEKGKQKGSFEDEFAKSTLRMVWRAEENIKELNAELAKFRKDLEDREFKKAEERLSYLDAKSSSISDIFWSLVEQEITGKL